MSFHDVQITFVEQHELLRVAKTTGRPKRRRKVSQRPTFDYCRSCRARKLKCDGERPTCGRCTAAGIACGGYAIWEIELGDTEQPEATLESMPALTHEDSISSEDSKFDSASDTPMSLVVDHASIHRIQLLSKFADRNYPDGTPAAPTTAHTIQSPFNALHALMGSQCSSPLLQSALETLCLSHLAADPYIATWLNRPLQESYTRLLCGLRTSMNNTSPARSSQHHRDIIASIVALSLMPTSGENPAEHKAFRRAHLLGASEYLQEYGPSVLDLGEQLSLSSVRHVHLYSAYTAFVKRKRVRWNESGWGKIREVKVTPKPEFPAAARYMPGHQAETGYYFYSPGDKHVMADFANPLSGLLERADDFVRAPQGDPDEYADLLQCLNHLQNGVFQVRPVVDVDELAGMPSIINVSNFDVLDIGIEEHAYMYNASTFREQYLFTNVEQGFNTAWSHQLLLIVDCALLQVMYNAGIEKGIPGPVDVISDFNLITVEQRAFWHASELCRCTYFYSQRGLTAAKFLHSLLSCARNFFECYGAELETLWCQGCILVTEMRMGRLKAMSSPSLCRLVDMAAGLSSGCRYGPGWQGVVENDWD